MTVSFKKSNTNIYKNKKKKKNHDRLKNKLKIPQIYTNQKIINENKPYTIILVKKI